MKRWLIVLAIFLTSCVNTVQYTSTEMELASALDACLRDNQSQRMVVLEASLQTIATSVMADQCVEGSRELAHRLNSCTDIVMNCPHGHLYEEIDNVNSQ